MAKGSSNWIWWTIGGLAVVGLGVGIFIFIKNRKAKKESEKSLDVPSPTTTPTTPSPTTTPTTPSIEPTKASAPKDDSNFPRWTKQQGDDFRAWVNDTYPAYAKENNLDRKGSADNSFIRKAWAKYGAEYKKGTTFAMSIDSDDFDSFMHESKLNYTMWT